MERISQASIAAIRSYEWEQNERQRLRMSARPLLQLIHSLLEKRKSADGSLELRHVRAHTDGADLHSVGNRLADYQANLARSRPDRSAPLSLRELPLYLLEHHLRLQRQGGTLIINDIRRTALAQCRTAGLAKWTAKVADQGALAGVGMIELGRITLRYGTASHSVARCNQLHPLPRRQLAHRHSDNCSVTTATPPCPSSTWPCAYHHPPHSSDSDCETTLSRS